MQVLDYSAGFPGAANIKALGYGGAVRYIGFPERQKCTNAAELRDFTAHSLGMALVYEDHADDWRTGASGGAAAARRAFDHALLIGFPVKQRPIYMAVDRDVVTESEFRVAMAYLRGAGSVLTPELVGVYGEHDVVARASAEGTAKWLWQCRAWSGTPVKLFAGRHLYQHVGYVYPGGVQSDYNDVLSADWGQHNYQLPILGERPKKMCSIVFEVTSEPEEFFEGFSIWVDQHKGRATGGIDASSLRTMAANSKGAIGHCGVTGATMRDLLRPEKYGEPLPPQEPVPAG